MSADAGRVALIPKDEWSSVGEYEILDVVSHNGSLYIAKQASVNREPIGETDDYWMLGVDSPSEMTGATEQEDGEGGLVPKPLAGDNGKVLFGDGTFKEVKSSALLIDSGYVAIDYSILGG